MATSIVDSGAPIVEFGNSGVLVEPTVRAPSKSGGRRKRRAGGGRSGGTAAKNLAKGQSPQREHNNNSIHSSSGSLRRDQHIDPHNFDELARLSELIRAMADLGTEKPRIGIICGSGLGALADRLEQTRVLPFAELPGFPAPGVVGHKGNLVFGHLAGQLCVCLQGRFHPYEHQMDMALCTMPVRVMAMLGVRTLVVSNAAGGINPEFKLGDLMIIKDHVFLPGLVGHSPLLGMNDARFGARFVSMHNAYDREIRRKARQLAMEMGIPAQEGIYVMNAGPQYETAAECDLIAKMGGDAVGMSTCHEVTVARQCGMRVFGFSLITNCASLDADQPVEITHEEVLDAANRASEMASEWIHRLVEGLQGD